MVKFNDRDILSSKDWKEMFREVISERLESMKLELAESQTSPGKRQAADGCGVEPSSKPLSYVNKDNLIEAATLALDKYDAKMVRDANHGCRLTYSRRMPTRRTHVAERYRSFTAVESVLQNPNPDSESSLSSCVSESKIRRSINVEERRSKKRNVDGGLEVEPIQMTPPEWLLHVMEKEENGYDPKLISTRKLYETDVHKGKSRLLVPFRQVHNPDFLTEEEKRIIDENARKIRERGLSVDLVDPMMNKHVLDLRKWKMSGNWYYALCDGWNNVVAANSFKFKDFFPLWSFRSGTGQLCFALVPPTPTSSSHGGGSTSGEPGLENSLPGGDDGASTSGESGQVPLPVPPSPPTRDSSNSSQGCSGESSSYSS